jgi:hypothetical protein
MNKKTLKALEKVFLAEIENRLPFQSKAKIYRKLADEGLILYGEGVISGRFPVRIKGFILTDYGRYIYCDSCKDSKE